MSASSLFGPSGAHGAAGASTIEVPLWAWLVLAAVVTVSLTIDLVGHRGEHGKGRKRAIAWSVAWLVVALTFCVWVGFQFGWASAGDFATAWLVEKSLSVDNLFVFLLVFSRLKIPEAEQHRVLFWGILGAVVTRGLFIAGGAALLARWHAVVYPMGAFLVYTAYKTLRDQSQPLDGENKVLSFARRYFPYRPQLDEHRFFTLENGRRVATPLMLALIVIEVTDIIFAVDSIPAVFAVTSEPFIVYSSNVFALLGLRALFLVLATLLLGLRYLRYGLAAILAFAGLKMLTSEIVHLPHWLSLLIVVGILVVTIVPSVIQRRRAIHA